MKFIDYKQTLDFLFVQTPMFQSVGAAAYKPGLETVERLSAIFSNPHERLRCIHVGGTNGKGSTAHTLAAVLQSAGLRVGLFTSPHLVDFRERIRIDGRMISEKEVVGFVNKYFALSAGSDIRPSFFELTTVMAFDHFARHAVDVAVIEVGLGGRLDSTNIISPDLSVITNISLDHTALLGHTPEAIAVEKAGIIKPGVPVVIGEAEGEVKKVFAETAARLGAPIVFADTVSNFSSCEITDHGIDYHNTPWGDIHGELSGDCQVKNASTILSALAGLKKKGYAITDAAVAEGFARVCSLTELAGRWMKIAENPTVICDTGHNPGGWQYLVPKLESYGRKLHMVIGFVNDKDISSILYVMPREAHYHFVCPSVPRGLPAEDLAARAAEFGLSGSVSPTVAEGYELALSQAASEDTIVVGGSTFVVADLLALL